MSGRRYDGKAFHTRGPAAGIQCTSVAETVLCAWSDKSFQTQILYPACAHVSVC